MVAYVIENDLMYTQIEQFTFHTHSCHLQSLTFASVALYFSMGSTVEKTKMASSTKDVNLEFANRQVWLVKVSDSE